MQLSETQNKLFAILFAAGEPLEAARLGEFVHRHDPDWDWGKPFDTGILDGYQQGVDTMI